MADDTTNARPAVARRLRRLLAAEGYRPRRSGPDEDPTVIRFKVEGNPFTLRCDEDDPDFVQLSTGYSLEDVTQDELTLLRAANDVQAETKVVKIYIPRSRAFVEFQVELFLGGRPFSPGLLERSIVTLRATCRDFTRRVTPPAPKAAA